MPRLLGEKNFVRGFVEKPKGKRPIGKARRRCEEKIKTVFKKEDE
jgi:hypothetical protein